MLPLSLNQCWIHCVNKYIYFLKEKVAVLLRLPYISHQFILCIKTHRKGKSWRWFCPLPSLFSWRSAGGFRAIMPWSALHTPFPVCYLQHQGPGRCRAGGENYRLPCWLALQRFIPLEMPFFFQDRVWYRAKCQFPAACTISLCVPVVLEMKKPWCYTISVWHLNHHSPPKRLFKFT